MSIKVGIYGATGYTGLELAALLAHHPDVSIAFATSERMAGHTLKDSHPQAPATPLIAAADASHHSVDAVFLCLPHTRSAQVAAQAADQGVRVIDLSADLRLNDPALYQQWYQAAHPAPGLLPVPYGLPEIGRRSLTGARLIANPGCYATAALLGLYPLVSADLVSPAVPLIIDAKSGVSGAGRVPRAHTVYGEVADNFSPYSIGRSHRHLPEIEQVLGQAGLESGRLIFSPHLLPTFRGILATIYVPVTDLRAAQQVFLDWYDDEPFVNVLPPGQIATLAHVVRTPYAVISLTLVGSTLIVVVAIDNLLKGASSQAVQNFNLMYGLPETAGLLPMQEVAR